jgi:DNA segregation ATPase FtsK/SpoIIIE-like protein
MLYQAPDSPSPARLQGVFVADHEIQRLVDYWKSQAGSTSPYVIAGTPAEALPAGLPLRQTPLWEESSKDDGDPLYSEAVDLIRREGRASYLLQPMRIGYTCAVV